MAGDAIRPQTDILVLLLIDVASLTRRCHMRPYKRESRLTVTLDHVWHQPRLACMAAFARHPQLASVDILMAVFALSRSTGEYERSMTLTAGNCRMLSFQRELCLRVVELRRNEHFLPRVRRVALLTGNREFPMG
jgi:hypothetical protein